MDRHLAGSEAHHGLLSFLQLLLLLVSLPLQLVSVLLQSFYLHSTHQKVLDSTYSSSLSHSWLSILIWDTRITSHDAAGDHGKCVDVCLRQVENMRNLQQIAVKHAHSEPAVVLVFHAA